MGSDGNLYLAGYTSSNLDGNWNAGSQDMFIMSFTSGGSWRWTAQRGGYSNDRALALKAAERKSLGETYRIS